MVDLFRTVEALEKAKDHFKIEVKDGWVLNWYQYCSWDHKVPDQAADFPIKTGVGDGVI